MANSGSFNTKDTGGIGANYPKRATYSWWVNSQSVANNTTNIGYKLVLGGGASSGSSIAVYNCSTTTAGESKSFSGGGTFYGNGKELISGTKTITHNADGTKSFSASATINLYWSSGHAVSGSGSWALPTIARQAYLSTVQNFNDNGNPTITYTNAAGNAVGTLQACIASSDGNTIYAAYRNINKTGTLSYTFNLTAAERNTLLAACANSNSLAVRFYVKTVIGSTTFYDYKAATMSVVSANPTFSNYTYSDTNSTITAITGNNQVLVAGKSSLSVVISSANKAVANKQATMKTYLASLSGKTVSANYSSSGNTLNFTSNAFTVGTQTLSVKATDSRGNATTVNKNVTIVGYSNPVINAVGARQNNFENNTTFTFSGSISPITVGGVRKNDLVGNVQYRYKNQNTSTWGSWTNLTASVASDGKLTINSITLSLDNTASWDMEVKVVDKLATSTKAIVISQGQPQFFVGDDGRVAVGGTPSISKPSANLGQLEIKGRAVRDAAGMWVKARENTVAYNEGGGGYAPSAASKSKNGVWSVGTYTSNDDLLYFNYTSDSDYNSNTNTYTGYTVETNGRTNLKPIYLNRRTETRPASANLSKEDTKYGNLSYMLATSSMTTGKIPGDGSIINMDWDNNGGYACQLGITHDSPSRLFTRTQNGGTWTNWVEYEALNSSAPFVSTLSTGGTSYTTTSSRNLIEKTITMTTSRKMILYGFAAIATSANTSNIAISVDGTVIGTHSTTNITGYFDGRSVIVITDNLSIGNHTIRLVLRSQNSSTTAKVATYSTCYLAGWVV